MSILQKITGILFVTLTTSSVKAQCAMCRAVGETSAETGGSGLAEGLNNGIIYLMIIPYILLFLLFRKKIIKFFKELGSMRS